jgi:hypothetical protein
MRHSALSLTAALALAAAVATAPAGVRAANADHPYENIDKRNDAGNDTGDSQVESLNRGQLDENQRPAGQAPFSGPAGPVVILPQPGTQAPPQPTSR